jgi:predicted 2-oxoglutarate/Fe(II)-dependent dioxygenase YbiX
VRADCNPAFRFHSVAGRYVVLFFLESSAREDSRRALELFLEGSRRFDGRTAVFAGITVDPGDEEPGRLTGAGKVSALYGAARDGGSSDYQRLTYVLDPRLRVLARLPFESSPEQHVAQVFTLLDTLPPPATVTVEAHAPILILPRVFDLELCAQLIRYHEQQGGEKSGFMREVEGRTRLVHDSKHKVRTDREIADVALRDAVLAGIRDRLVPEIARAFQFGVTRVERHLIACYDAAAQAHFAPHRDNTTQGTAHRRFAVTINLNAGDYEGGALRFPEYGSQTYVPPTGAALVFSCSMLHEVVPVTRGKRYAYLPFLYDEAAAAVREENRKFVDLR